MNGSSCEGQPMRKPEAAGSTMHAPDEWLAPIGPNSSVLLIRGDRLHVVCGPITRTAVVRGLLPDAGRVIVRYDESREFESITTDRITATLAY